MRRPRFVLASLALVGATPAWAEDCRQKLDPLQAGALSYLSDNDLVGLRDFGASAGYSSEETPFAFSPDGSRVALALRRADADSNSYCNGLLVFDLVRRRSVLLTVGGEYIARMGAPFDMQDYATGVAVTNRPVWSEDGRWIAYLRRDNGSTQLWRVRTDGSVNEQLTRLSWDVEGVASVGKGGIILSGRPTIALGQQQIRKEGLSGFRYDDRFLPMVRNSPFVRGPASTQYLFLEPESGLIRKAQADEIAKISPSRGHAWPANARLVAFEQGRARAWLASQSTEYLNPPMRIAARGPAGQEMLCKSIICSGDIVGLWWDGSASRVIFQRMEGWGDSRFSFYAWRAGQAEPKLLYASDDFVAGCQYQAPSLYCVTETSTHPRTLSRLDLHRGTRETLFDPNPEFGGLKLGPVERLHWRNQQGLECYGDLVLPPDYKPGQRLPLIIVQYRSQGFLRGGTGDEYPIQLFAQRGFAVLSFERPHDIAMKHLIKNPNDIGRINLEGWADRKNVQSSLETAIALLVERGIVDRAHIGITGLSDGAATVFYALVNSRLFAAAAISSCCESPSSVATVTGPVFGRHLADIGYPTLKAPNPDFWRSYALSVNAAQLDTPILMQLADSEYLYALETIHALQGEGKTVEAYVFPDERHIKWQPAHRLAIYRRNLAWFERWLKPH